MRNEVRGLVGRTVSDAIAQKLAEIAETNVYKHDDVPVIPEARTRKERREQRSARKREERKATKLAMKEERRKAREQPQQE